MDEVKLNKILESHKLWLHGKGRERANLLGADLQEADLMEADLQEANLQEANLRGADLQEAYLWGALGNMKEIKSLQIETYTITYTSEVLQIGCKQYPFDKWWSFSDAEIYQMDGTKAVEWWHKYKELIRSIVELSPAVPTNGEENESI